MKLLANIDGGSRGNPGPAASAFVLVSEDGVSVGQAGVYIGKATNNRAEYFALKIALEAALEAGADEIEVRSDSLLLVNQFNGVYKIKDAGLFRMMSEIMALRRNFAAVRLAHVPREQNKAADALVNKTLDAAIKTKAAPMTLPPAFTQGDLF
ncbi:MAG: ribonuclease HI family protein [Elusimicrobiales bacterium]